MFSQELIWSGEICYTNIVVSGLILKMRSEGTLQEDMTYFIAFSFSYTATFFQTWIRATCLTKLSKQTTRQPSISVTIEDYRQIIIIVATKYSEKWLYLYAYCLRSIFYCCSLITHFRKTNSMAKVTTRASAIVTKIITSLVVKGTLATPHLL